ncbi:alpha/beta hydrolase [Streptomyces sp. NPDC005263]|uniref:alpha/beta hydrolase n=1 Tax=Streptomyces sp. NPDC005263 TaxID=3364711 RepID=UPI00368889D7
MVPLSGAARPAIPAPAPAALGKVTATTLEDAYAANRANAERASRMADAHDDRARAATDRAMAALSRHFLTFDGRGAGRTAEVLGDLAHADRVAVLVPGSDTSLDTYDRFRATATHLRTELNRQTAESTATRTRTRTRTGTATGTGTGTGHRTAVVAWLGYETPATVSLTVATSGRAEQAAPRLREFIRQLRGIVGEKARLSLLCHSYGSVVCGRAAAGLDVDDIALVGSPGTGADTAAGLRTRARVWAARGADDWVGEVPHVKTDLFGTTVGFGTDPTSPSFGARVFAAGDGGHSDYFAPGSVSLTNLARIVLGAASEVTRA